MDLAGKAAQMRLDALAVAACRALAEGSIPHVLLKGPTTSSWLYDPPRGSRDVDLLVPGSLAGKAVDALRGNGIAQPAAGELGEEAHHSRLLLSPAGFELDLHVTLPSTPVPTGAEEEALWAALSPHVEAFIIDGSPVPALDLPGRFLVVALHALSSPGEGQAHEDLRRAASAAGPDVTSSMLLLARELAVEHLALAALAVNAGAMDAARLPLEYRLLHRGASGAYQLHRLAGTSLRRLPGRVWREAFPSVGFMRHATPSAVSRRGLWRAYAVRLVRLAREIPGQIRILIQERRNLNQR